MAKLRNMLKKESNVIDNDENVGKRTDCTDIMISAKFGEDHIHHILPSQPVIDNFVDDLMAYTSEDFNRSLTKSNNNKEENKPPKEVIFHNRQAFGDILTMTCLYYHSPVLLDNGKTELIGKIVKDKKEVIVKSFNENKNVFENKKVTNWIKHDIGNHIWHHVTYENAPISQVTKKGQGVYLTEDHKILTRRGMVRVDEIEENDVILTREKCLNEKQKQFFIGTILGDSWLVNTRTEGRGYFSYKHSDVQLELVCLKNKALNGFDFSIYTTKGKGNRKNTIHSQYRTNVEFGQLYNEWYKNGKKSIPINLSEDDFTPLTLAVWYMDDGNLNGDTGALLCTESFTKEENKFLSNILKNKFNLNVKIRKNNRLYIGNGNKHSDDKSSDKFFEMISPYIPNSFKYKLPEKYRDIEFDIDLWDIGTADLYYAKPIIEKDKPSSEEYSRYVYCLEVEDNHNFISNNMVFSNCAIRDFKNQFPKTRVGVHTTAMHIWDNNPHIDHIFRMGSLSANKAVVKIGPGFLTNKSGMWDYHMANAFRMDIQNKTGLKITQGPVRPDIWLTEEEFNRKPVIDIDKPYWVFIYGGEPGWPSKQYHRWQEVIDILKDDVQFVQLGVKGHPYPRLNNVIDFVGKTEDRNTGIRDLFNIFLHAEGSMGLVSMHMHLSAAFNNPCVVGDTLIVTENGLNFPVNLIDEKFNAIVDGKLYNSNGFWKTGNKKILELKMKSGRKLNVTYNHRIMTTNGWKEAGDIDIGEKIKINNHREYNFNLDFKSRDYAKGYLLGNLLSDGHINRKSAVVMWFDKDRNKYYEDGLYLMDQAGWALSRRPRAKDNGVSRRISTFNLYDFAKEKGCIGENGKKCFTKKTLIGTWSYLSGLIAGYFDGDGTVGDYGSHKNLSISSIEYKNLELLQMALSSFGIGSKIYKENKCRLNSFADSNKQYNIKPIHRIIVSGDDLGEFLKKINIRNEDKLNKLRNIEETRTRKAKINRFYDVLVEVNEKENEDVYDCEVDEIHAFDANSVYVHNCVVLAAGREPASFTQYYGHQYIQNNGALPCVEQKACWACKLEGCKNLTKPTNTPTNGHNTMEKIPKCVDIIEPEQIAEGIRMYYKGGRLNYKKKTPNNFFKNIVREKKVFSIPQPKKVDNDLLKKYGFEWGGGSITDKDWLFICDIFDTYGVKKVLEFGAGLSTLLMATKANKIVTFETQQGWIDKIKVMSDKEKNYLFLWDGKKLDLDSNDFKDLKFDFAFVDGPAGGVNREFSTMYASKLSDLIVVHDAGREWERKWQEKYLSKDFELLSKGGHRCHFWVKKEIAKKKEEEKNEEIKVKIENDNRKSFRMVTTCRGFGGSERSSLFIMKDMLNRGYRVELISTGNISGEYKNNIPSDVIVRPWNDMSEPVDLLTFYTSDCIFNFNKPQYLNMMDKLNCKKKVMILNYKLGWAGKSEWTKKFDSYMFLNSTNKKSLLERIPNAKTKVLPPPTDLTDFFKVNVDYGNGIRLGRHSSQRDAKWPDYSNEMIQQIWDEINEDIKFYFMPSRSNCIDDHRIYKFKVNEIKVNEFLSKINLFFYHLPPGYTDAGPRVILEAAACGLPIIADNHSGPKDRVIPEIGWLCDDVSDYLDIISDINKDLTIIEKKGKMARKYAKENFIGKKWCDYIIGD